MTPCLGVPSCRLAFLGGGGWLTASHLPPACWLLEQVGFIHAGLLVVSGNLCAMRPGGFRHMHVGSTVPSLASGGGAWIRPPDGEQIHSEYPSIYPYIYTYIYIYIYIHTHTHTHTKTHTHTHTHTYTYTNTHTHI